MLDFMHPIGPLGGCWAGRSRYGGTKPDLERDG
jgi:hypothetical protein